MDPNQFSSAIVEIRNVRGLHARASAKFVKCADEFSAEINVTCNGQTVPGTSIMGLMMLGAAKGTQIRLDAKGVDHADAILALSNLVKMKFEEE